MGRKYIDCSEYPSDSNCSLRLSGAEDEVLTAAVHHAVTVHGHEDSPETKEQIRGLLKEE
jgi:predicted small metal-binding protein